jgi:hypothetical protein
MGRAVLSGSVFGASLFGARLIDPSFGEVPRGNRGGGFFLGPYARLHAEPFRFPRKGGALLRRHAEAIGRRFLIKERDPEILFCREHHQASIASPL